MYIEKQQQQNHPTTVVKDSFSTGYAYVKVMQDQSLRKGKKR